MIDRQATVAHAQHMLSEGRARIRMQFMAENMSGHQTADALAILMDETLQFIWHEVGANLNVDLANHLALLAIGGYGRGQLAPHSDVDLLFLRISKNKILQDQAVKTVLYILWDLDLKVGQAVRTPGECLKLGAEDFTILTSLIEMRLIRGSRQGFTALRNAVDRRLLAPRRGVFVMAKMAEREMRHERHGQSCYVLEPNVKENKGGLRDLHTLSWISRAVFGDGQVNTLMSHGVFSLAQARAYQSAEAFLLTVRIHLHYLLDRAEDRLSFDAQITIAEAMGFIQDDRRTGVEAFMQAYFRAAKEVGALTGLIIATIEEEFNDQSGGWRRGWRQRKENCEGFYLIAGRLALRGAQQLVDTPLEFLRYFMVAHERGLGHAPSSLRLMSQNLRLIDQDLKNVAEANALFLDLLTHAQNPTLALRTMNETGVLAAFLPEWQSVVGLMQFNRYHHFTVDEHTLHAIDQLHQLRAHDLGDMTGCVHEVMEQISDMTVLFVAMLYHDIAKGRPGRHEIEGAKLAPAICRRLNLSSTQSKQVTWIIREHLSLSAIAFQRDLDDPVTLQSLADMVQNMESLRLLYALTAADIRAVGPEAWSAWKGSLLQKAYSGTREILCSDRAHSGESAATRAQTGRRQAAAILAGQHKVDLANFLKFAPDPYWFAYDKDSYEFHFDLMQRVPSVDVRLLKQQKTMVLTTCANDKPDLFACLAGAVTLAGWTVEAGKAHIFRHGVALNTFFIHKLGSKSQPNLGDQHHLKSLIKDVLKSDLQLAELNAKLPRKRSKRQRVMDQPSSVRIYSPDLMNSPTIIEVTGPDRPALLFDLTATIRQLGLSLRSLRIATYGERFVNAFYVTDLMGYRLEGDDKLEKIKTALVTAAEKGASL